MISANTLGINSQTPAYYQRKTTCAPVRAEDFVDTQDNYKGFLLQSQFYYGPAVNSNWTFAESRIFSLPGTSVPAYQVTVKKAGYFGPENPPAVQVLRLTFSLGSTSLQYLNSSTLTEAIQSFSL